MGHQPLLQFAVLVIVLVVFGPSKVLARCKELPIPKILAKCIKERTAMFPDLTNEVIYEYCTQTYVVKTPNDRWQRKNPLDTNAGKKAFSKLWRKGIDEYKRRKKRSAMFEGFNNDGCVRREVRDLTEQEWSDFLGAVKAAMNDIDPETGKSIFELFAEMHSGTKISKAHNSVRFLPWHRCLLYAFEQALKKYNPNVCLPYWDSSYESNVPYPEQSSLFHDTITGSYEPSIVSSYNVTRVFAQSRSLLCSNGKISYMVNVAEYIRALYLCEIFHNEVHTYIGGDMANLDNAAFDLIFWLHHCNIDRLFSIIKKKFKNVPYPYGDVGEDELMPVFGEELNLPFVNGDGPMTVKDGVSDVWDDEMIQYADSPCNCTEGYCGRRKLIWCYPYRYQGQNYCQPLHISRLEDSYRKKRSAKRSKRASSTTEYGSGYDLKSRRYRTPLMHNTYKVDGENDRCKWVFLPVRVIFLKPPGVRFNTEKKEKDVCDIYYIRKLDSRAKKTTQRQFSTCDEDGSGTIKVIVKTTGKNYNGQFEEYGLIDERLPISETVVYTAIRKPTPGNNTEVILSAYDECGRTCRVMCLVEGSKPPIYKDCSGVISVDTRYPITYGQTFEETVNFSWRIPDDLANEAPRKKRVSYCIQVVCDEVKKPCKG